MILNESYVLEGITKKDLQQIVGQITETNTITFNKDELTPKGTEHIKSLHVAVECRGMIIQVMIDNGPSYRFVQPWP